MLQALPIIFVKVIRFFERFRGDCAGILHQGANHLFFIHPFFADSKKRRAVVRDGVDERQQRSLRRSRIQLERNRRFFIRLALLQKRIQIFKLQGRAILMRVDDEISPDEQQRKIQLFPQNRAVKAEHNQRRADDSAFVSAAIGNT